MASVPLPTPTHAFVFAAGDCASQRGRPYAKAGTYAVRHGPVLAENLERFATDRYNEPRPFWFRVMTRRILRGLRRAAVVVCGSVTARNDLLRFGLVDPRRRHQRR